MRRKTRKNKKLLIILGVFLVLFVFVIGLKTAKFVPFFYQLLFYRSIDLKKNSQGKINLLLLGIGGGTHDGPNLSDTIIFASLDQKANKITLVSIPRDLWIDDLKEKINAAYAIGENKQKGSGLVLAKAVVSKITGQEIDYGVRIDFDGFVKAVDQVGGLDIDVARAFDDYEYPIDGKENDPCGHNQEELAGLATASSQLVTFPCRYMHLHFDKGMRHMDGQTVLQYVRSRHAEGSEGTDFARSQRQEKVISAFKSKVFSAQTLLNPATVLSLYGILQNSIDTDIKQDEFDDFIRLAQKMKGAKIESTVIDYGDASQDRAGLLINPPPSADYSYSWILIPRKGGNDYSEIKQYITCEIQFVNCVVPKTPGAAIAPSPSVSPTKNVSK